MFKCLLLCGFLTTFSLPAFAQQSSCAAVADNKARLACFDSLARHNPKPIADEKATPEDDAIATKAKLAVVKKMKDADFEKVTTIIRTMRPNVQEEPMDTICGYVNAKNSHGGYTGEKPFVYFAQDGTGYLADASNPEGMTDSMIYQNFCL
jgi:hypothetical protein